MVDVMKRRERERVMTEIIEQIQTEKEALLQVERRKSQESRLKGVDEILIENQRKIEASSVPVLPQPQPSACSLSLPLYLFLSFRLGIETQRVPGQAERGL
jgi:hypothetical protein